MTEQDTARYHHGELPNTLMELALKHINKEGTDKLSLRALAREAGVSPTAPYSHFPTKMCLLAAIATRGFTQLRAHLEQSVSDDETAFENMVSIGLAYINFARQHPTEYKLMFGSVMIDFSRYAMLVEAAESSYGVVQERVRLLMEEANLSADPDLVNASCWSLVHGISSLLIDKANIELPTRSPMHSVRALSNNPEAALRLMMQGMVSQHR